MAYADYDYGIENIVGKTVLKVHVGDDYVKLDFTDGTYMTMEHEQDCCESVSLEEYSHAELEDLKDQTILSARVDTEEENSDYGIAGWTFYNIQGNRSFANLRWFGESNGYYSIGVTAKVLKRK